MDDNEENELRNPFPSPPAHFTTYTDSNLDSLKLLRLRRESSESRDESVDQKLQLHDETGVPDWPLEQLVKPRVDWILEDGEYTVFGDTWQTREHIPTLAELGGNQLYPSDTTTDRRPALLSILRSLLLSYSSLLKVLLAPPLSVKSNQEPEWTRHIEWIASMCQNIMGAANDLRPVQARVNLETMMQSQLRTRRTETDSIHRRCDEMEEKLVFLKLKASSLDAKSQRLLQSSAIKTNETDIGEPIAPLEGTGSQKGHVIAGIPEILAWADEVFET